MPIPKDMQVGTIHPTNGSGDLEVIFYHNFKEVGVRFLKRGYMTVKSAKDIRRGAVKDRYIPTVCGVGYIGGSHHKSKEVVDGQWVHTKPYAVWNNMIRRCYDDSRGDYKYYGELGVTVVEDWHNYQNFADWYLSEMEQLDLDVTDDFKMDKDIKAVEGQPKQYGSDTCKLVSHQENCMFSHGKTYYFLNPDKELVVIYNLKEYCRENELGYISMINVHSGKYKKHKKWTKA